MEADKPNNTICTVVAIDHTDLYYSVCSFCEKTLPKTNGTAPSCNHCRITAAAPTRTSSKRLFRVLMSVATDTKVFVVVMFDRAARVLFGCSAEDFFNFVKIHPFAADTASKILEGEMLRVTLVKPKNGNAQHQRVASVIPLKSGFRPIIHRLSELYGTLDRESSYNESA